jgi:phosphoglycerol transferase MdoB-like AlkP superfamily enzyme
MLMRPFVSKRVQQQINKRLYRARPFLFATIVTLLLLWMEMLYRWLTTPSFLHSDMIHIAWINASIAFLFVFFLGFLPRSLHRLLTIAFLSFFTISFIVQTVLTASHIQYADLSFINSWEMVDLYRRRYEQYVVPLLIVGLVPLLWGLFPMRLRRSVRQQLALGLWTTLILLLSFSYLTNPAYANKTDAMTNWEMLIYPDRPMASRNRVGIHQDAIQQLLNQPLFIRPVQENVLGELSNYLINNNTIQGRSSYAFRGQNVIVFQIEGLRGEALNERVMPFLSKEIYPESIRFNEYYSDLKEINNYGVNFPLLTGIPLQENVNNTIESYRFNSFPNSLPNLFRQRNYATVAFHQFFSVPERSFIDTVGFDARFDYFSFPTWIDNDVEFVEASIRLLPKNQRFLAYYHFNNPHVQRGIPYISEFESFAGSRARAEYFSEMNHVDLAIKRAVDYLKRNDMWDNTVIMVVGMNPSLVDVDVTATNRIANYNTPFFIHGKGANQDIDQVMGPTDVIPSLMSMFAFKPDNYYLGRSVFSAGQNTVTFRDGSWVSNAGYYDANMQRFVISDPIYRTDFLGTYIDMTTQRMQERKRIGRLILERNYFAQEVI